MIRSQTMEKTINVIIINVNNEKYLLEVKDVKEIYIPGESIVPVPLADKSNIGIIDIRGEIYSIISLRHKINPNVVDLNLTKKSRIILLETGNLNVALLVDRVIGVQQLPISVFEEKSTIIETTIDYEFIRSIGVVDEESYILLDLEALVPPMYYEMDYKPEIKPRLKNESSPADESRSISSKEEVDLPRLPSMKGKKPSPRTPTIRSKSLATEIDINLSREQQDTLREIGNIGSGNAITALSRLIKKKVDVDLTEVGIMSFSELSDHFGGEHERVCGIFSQVKGSSDSTILQVFDLEPILTVVKELAGKDSKINPAKVKTKSDLNEFSISTIKEMGNIMAGHYASALADLVGTKMMIDIPEFTLSKAGEFSEFLTQELDTATQLIITIKTAIQIKDLKLNGMFFFIPDVDALKDIFKKLDIDHSSLDGAIKKKSKANTKVKTIKKKQSKKPQKIEDIKLTELQRDALTEVGNMGAGNAANALANLIKRRVDIDIPSVEMVSLKDYASQISEEKKELFVAWSSVVGKARATVLSIFNVKDTIDITSILVDDPKKKKIDLRKKYTDPQDFPKEYYEGLYELINILASHYANALSDLLGIKMLIEPPDMSIDTGEQLFEILKKEIGLLEKLSLVITTNVIISDIKISGTFLYIPDINTIQELLKVLEDFYS